MPLAGIRREKQDPAETPRIARLAGKLQALRMAAYNLGLARDRRDRALLTGNKLQTGIDQKRSLVNAEHERQIVDGLMVPGERETSNTKPAIEGALFETLEEWNEYLKSEDVDFSELPSETPPRSRKSLRGPTP